MQAATPTPTSTTQAAVPAVVLSSMAPSILSPRLLLHHLHRLANKAIVEKKAAR
jgi:hypothetical protein